MTTLHQTDIDGVRSFWVDSGRPTLSAVLLFRCGSADEPLHESGWLHMLEHLALHDRGGGALHVNGSVSPLITTFEAHGPAEQVVNHLRGVTQWLNDPVFAELERERGVLRAEAATRGGPGVRAFGWRYGARGPGVLAMGESGLGRATPDGLQVLARQVFTQGNAALVLDGPPPPGLELTLPPGELLTPARAVPCEDNLPAGYVDESGVVISGVVPRSADATFVPELLQRALRAEFRDVAGGSYAPWCTYEGVDHDNALVLAGSDVSRELLPTLAPKTLDLVRRIAENGPDAAQLSELVEARAQAMSDPYNRPMLAFRAAHFALDGRPPQTHAEMLEELHATDAEVVREAADSFSRSLLLGVPGETKWDNLLPMIEQRRGVGWVTGQRFRHQNWPAERAFLVIDEEDAHQVQRDGAYVSYRADEVEGMHVYEDGGRHLITRDGWGITVNPGEWRKGEHLVAALDRMVPEDRHLPHPARPHPQHGERRALFSRLWHGRSEIYRLPAVALTVAGMFLVLAVVALLTGNVLGVITMSAMTFLVFREWLNNHQERVYRR